MQKVASNFDLQLSWSYLIELAGIENETKRSFYLRMATNGNWNVGKLRTHVDAMLFERSAIAKHPENIIAESLKSWVESQ